MNILLVVSSMNAESGGVTTIVAGISDALSQRGHNVCVATVDHSGTQVNPTLATVTRFTADKGWKSLSPSRELAAFLRRRVREFDIVHVHGIWQRPGHYVGHYARRAGVPYVVSTHGMLDRSSLKMGRGWAKSLAWMLWDGPMIRRASAVQCSNDAEYRVSPKLHGRNVFVAGNGVSAEALSTMPKRGSWRAKNLSTLGRPDRPVALFLSRIHPKKGLERLLPHWPHLLKEYPDVLLVVAGAGSEADEKSVRAAAQAAGIGGSVFFAGQLVGLAKWEALVDADLFVLPTHQEAFSLAITEALAASCPVIITREANFDEIGPCRAGIIVDGRDMAQFVRAVGQVLSDPHLRQEMGINGRRLVESRFTWPTIAERLELAYRFLCRAEPIPTKLRAGADALADIGR